MTGTFANFRIKRTMKANPEDMSRWKRWWRPVGELGLAFAEVFSALAMFEIYAPWNALPGAQILGPLVDKPFTAISKWLAGSVFHVSGVAGTPHPTDSRDTALGWTTLLVVAVVSAVISVVLSRSLFSKCGRLEYKLWLRYFIRFELIAIMFRYSMFKIFPLQMSRPSLGVLNEAVGQSSPMTLLWTLIGLSPAYQIMSGIFEACCAVLLFFRRTALLGTIVGLIVIMNIVALNLCFDVPVKLGALLLLFAFATLLSPDLPSLWTYFLGNTPTKPRMCWRPEFLSCRSRATAIMLEVLVVSFTLYNIVPVSRQAAAEEAKKVAASSPLVGEWQVDSATKVDGQRVTDAPVLTAEGSPMIAIYFEPDGRAMARSKDNRLWRAGADVDQKRHTVDVFSGYFEGRRFQGSFRYSFTDRDHLVLTPISTDADLSTLRLSRVPLPPTYPLLQTPFHWVQEWALER